MVFLFCACFKLNFFAIFKLQGIYSSFWFYAELFRPCETAVVSPSAACHIASSSPTSSPTRNNSCTQSGEKNESASAGCCRRLVGVEGATDRRLCTTLSREESTGMSLDFLLSGKENVRSVFLIIIIFVLWHA